MSALPMTINRLSPAFHSRLTEADALCEISRHMAYAHSPHQVIEAIASIALRVAGIHKIQIEDRMSGRVPARAAVGTAHSGSVATTFDLHIASLESPVRFVRFLEEQVCRIHELAELRSRNTQIRTRPQSLGNVIMRRKIIYRACGIVSRREALNTFAALLRMRSWSRERNTSLLELSRDIIRHETAGSAVTRRLPVAVGRMPARSRQTARRRARL